jgi:hypothetical protein
MGIYLGGFQRRIPQNLLNSEDHHIEWLGRDAYTWNNPEYASQKTVSFGKRPDEVMKFLNASSLSVPSQGDQPVAFARLIAKISYAMAVAQGQANLIDGQPFVHPAILGESDDIGRWVGTLTKPITKHPGVLHRADIRKDEKNGLLVAEVQLFADSETPAYGVLLGRLKNFTA